MATPSPRLAFGRVPALGDHWLIIDLNVWQDIDALTAFMYPGRHRALPARRRRGSPCSSEAESSGEVQADGERRVQAPPGTASLRLSQSAATVSTPVRAATIPPVMAHVVSTSPKPSAALQSAAVRSSG